MRVLLIEDDHATAQGIELLLRSEDMDVDTVSSGEAGLSAIENDDYAIALLDINLPDLSGFDVLKQARGRDIHTPVLILSGNAATHNKVQGLQSGADDYLTKPFHRDELLARIQSVTRRAKTGGAHNIIKTGNIEVDLDAQIVSVHGKKIPMNRKEYGMLELLSLRKGATVTKAQFMAHLYGGIDEPEDKIISVFLAKLRKKLAAANDDETYIETVWGQGLMLVDPGETSHGVKDTFENAAKPVLQVTYQNDVLNRVRLDGTGIALNDVQLRIFDQAFRHRTREKAVSREEMYISANYDTSSDLGKRGRFQADLRHIREEFVKAAPQLKPKNNFGKKSIIESMARTGGYRFNTDAVEIAKPEYL